MSIYLDLIPPPQFDRSLVAYTVGNFGRIKDALVRASGRTYVFNVQSTGAWPKSFTITHPFRADVLVTYGATCWALAVGMAGTALQLDGAFVGTWGYYFMNESSSHKQTTGAHVARNLAAGDHQWTITIPAGNTSSDGNDWGWIAFTMTEV
jgi:hypothetical protein